MAMVLDGLGMAVVQLAARACGLPQIDRVGASDKDEDNTIPWQRLLGGARESRVFAARLDQQFESLLFEQFPQATDHQRHAAWTRARDLFASTDIAPDRADSIVIKPASLFNLLMECGDRQVGSELGGEAGRMFRLLVTMGVDVIIRHAPISEGFSTGGTGHMLRGAEALLSHHEVAGAGLDELESVARRVLDQALHAPQPGDEIGTHRQSAEELAPPTLLGRAVKIGQMERFVLDDDEDWWEWIAPPQSGKTALMATFALTPPAGVELVPFFVRTDTSNGWRSFLGVVVPWLGYLAGRENVVVPETWERGRVEMQLLLAEAAEAVRGGRRGNGRIVLLIDGIDKDVNHGSHADRRSIVALLPEQLPPGVKVLISRRPTTDDVAIHPLSTPDSRHQLSVSEHARAAFSQDDVARIMVDSVGRDVMAFFAATEGVLTEADITELVRQQHPACPPEHVATIIQRAPARILLRVAGREGRAPAYRIGHELLLNHTARQLDPALRDGGPRDDDAESWRRLHHRVFRSYRDRVHAWADSYAERGWPETTPGYLLSTYPLLVRQDSENLASLVELLTDPHRNERLLARHGTHHPANAQIRNAAIWLIQKAEEDADFAVPVALVRRLLSTSTSLMLKNLAMTPSLPAVAARIGEPDLAVQLLNLVKHDQRSRAVAALIPALVMSREVARARAVARELTDDSSKTPALTELVTALARTGDLTATHEVIGDARLAARTIADDWVRAGVFTEFVRVLAEAGELGQSAPVLEEARSIVQAIPDPGVRTGLLTDLARVLVRAGAVGLARDLLADARHAAAGIDSATGRAGALTDVVRVLAQAGEACLAPALIDDARNAALAIGPDAGRATAVTDLVGVLLHAGESGLAERLLAAALAATEAVANPWSRARASVELGRMLIRTGHVDEAHHLALAVADAEDRANVLNELARVLVHQGAADEATGWLVEARKATLTLPPASGLAKVQSRLAGVLGQAGHVDPAHDLALGIIDPEQRASALTELAEALAASGHASGLPELLMDARKAARSIPNSWIRSQSLTRLAGLLIRTGDVRRAHELVDDARTAAITVQNEIYRTEALAGLADVLAAAGRVDQADDIALAIGDDEMRAREAARLAHEHLDRGEVRRAAILMLHAWLALTAV